MNPWNSAIDYAERGDPNPLDHLLFEENYKPTRQQRADLFDLIGGPSRRRVTKLARIFIRYRALRATIKGGEERVKILAKESGLDIRTIRAYCYEQGDSAVRARVRELETSECISED